MKIEISQATYEFIIGQLVSDDHDCSWQLAGLAPQHKVDNTNLYQYWKNKQSTIKNAIRELKGLV